MKRTLLCGAVSVWMAGCGGLPPPLDEQAVSKKVSLALSPVKVVEPVLQLLGVLPKEGCGVPRSLALVGFVESTHREFLGATFALEHSTEADLLRIQFPPQGTWVRGHHVWGDLVVTLSGGDDRYAAQLDFRGTRVDGQSVPARVGYLSCGDAKTYAVLAEGQHDGWKAAVDLALTLEDGRWPWNPPAYTLDGVGALSHPDGEERVAFDRLRYTLGDLTPEDGSLSIHTSTGHSVEARFEDGEGMAVGIDGGRTVKLPVPLP